MQEYPLSMAEKKTKLSASDIGSIRPDSTNTGSEMLKALNHLRENILLYVAGIAFLIICIIAGILFRVAAMNAEKQIMTDYAAAMANEDPAIRAAELESVSRHSGPWGLEALYALGEAAIQAGEYDRARNAFQELLLQAPKSPFAPNAAEGLAWLAENRGELEEALHQYEGVQNEFPGTFLARIQPLNIGRVQEKLGNIEAAIAAYESQTAAFPDSNAAREAQEALDRLRTSHPDLFPEPIIFEETEAPVEEAPVEEAPVEEAPVEEAPVEEAPVEEAPVEEAPVEEAPVEEAPVEEAPVEEAPVEEAPVEEAPVEEAPVEEAPVEEAPVEEELLTDEAE